MIDKLRVQQILINLIQNSIKYSKTGDTITIEISTNSSVEGTLNVEFRVIDKGIGISLEDRANLFSPYFKSKDEKKKGFISHGLGLSISKKIAKGLGGDL